MSFPDPAPTTELEAVNSLLTTIGEAPVNSIETPQTVDVSIAVSVLRDVSRDVQTKGWSFNTDKDYDLALNGSGKIPLPANAVRVEFDKSLCGSVDPVVRGSRVYDRKSQTFIFTKLVTAKKIVFLLPFTDLPQAARTYITIRSCRRFTDKQLGANEIHTYTMQEEMDAWRLLLTDEANAEDYNVLRNPSIWPTILR